MKLKVLYCAILMGIMSVVSCYSESNTVQLIPGKYVANIDLPEGSYIITLSEESSDLNIVMRDKNGEQLWFVMLNHKEPGITDRYKFFLDETNILSISQGAATIAKAEPLFSF